MTAVQAQLFEGLEAATPFGGEWTRLLESSSAEPTTSLEWTLALARHYMQPRDRFFLVRLHRAGDAVAFVPLIGRTFHALRQRWLRLMPVSEIFNTHGDLLLAERTPEIVDALFDALPALGVRWDCFRMSKLLESNSLGDLLASRARARGWIVRSGFGGATYHLPLPRTFDEYLAARSAKFRNHARRAEKKLRAAGTPQVREITDPAAFPAAFDALLRIEETSWKESQGLSIHALARQTAFYREWGEAAAAAGHLHVQLLTLDGEPIAHNLGYLCGGRYHYLKTSYAARHRPLGPATFLRLRLIESLIAGGIREIDFPGRPYDWERQWTAVVRWENVLSIYPATLRGRLLAPFDGWIHRSSPVRRFESVGTRPVEEPEGASGRGV